MANKNTRQLRAKIKDATRRGEDTVSIQRPVYNYHSHQGSKDSAFVTVSFPTARMKGDGVNSVNKRRNSCQRIYLNRTDGGSTQSLTAHEPFLKHEPMIFPNHRQYENWEYRRPQGQASA